MIGPIDRNLNMVAVEERLAVNATGGTSIDVPIAGATVISNVPCIHAREIIIMVTSTTKLKHVYLRMYGGERTQRIDIMLGTVASNTTALFQYTLGAAQSYDVVLVPDIALANVQCWTCAR